MRKIWNVFRTKISYHRTRPSKAFNVNCESVKPEFAARIEYRVTPNLSSYFLTRFPQFEFYKALSKSSLQNLKSHARKIIAMFASSDIREQEFSTIWSFVKTALETDWLTTVQLHGILVILMRLLNIGWTSADQTSNLKKKNTIGFKRFVAL